MIIDAHIHLWNTINGNIGRKVKAGSNGKIKIGNEEYLGMPPCFLDGRCPIEMAVSFMDAAGVDAAVVTQEYFDGNQNEYLGEGVRQNSERFFVHGLLEFRKPGRLMNEFNAAVAQYGFKGIKMPARYLPGLLPRIFLTDKKLMAVFAKMEEKGMILSVDLAEGETQVEEMRSVARTFPGLIITLGHFAMAGRKGWLKQLALAGEPNIYVESGGITWLYRREGFPFPGAQKAIRDAVDRVGADKLMWGSDFPRTMVDFTYEQTLDFVLHGCPFLSSLERNLILGGNAASIFGFKKPSKPGYRIKKITELD